MSGYTIKRQSNYEGFKALDQLLEKIDSGALKPPRQAKVEFWCPLCRCTKKNQRLISSRVLGRPVSQLGVEFRVMFQGRFILGCEDCARDVEKAKVA